MNKPLFAELAKLAERCDCRLHTHLCQVEDEERFCVEAHGMRPVDFLEENGWLNSRVWIAHAVHFNADDIRRLGGAGVGISHCAASDMVLAAGICPTKDFEAAGAAVGLGVDGSSSNDSLQHDGGGAPFADARPAALRRLAPSRISMRCAGRPRAPRAASGATTSARIAVGKQADLALFTLDEPRFSGAHDPLAALVLCGAHRADRVMVAGEWRVIDGMPERDRPRAIDGAAPRGGQGLRLSAFRAPRRRRW